MNVVLTLLLWVGCTITASVSTYTAVSILIGANVGWLHLSALMWVGIWSIYGVLMSMSEDEFDPSQQRPGHQRIRLALMLGPCIWICMILIVGFAAFRKLVRKVAQ